MVREAKDLSIEQRAAAELLLGRPLDEKESISVQAFASGPVSAERRREVRAELRKLFDEVDINLQSTTREEVEETFTEAMRSSRPGYRNHR
jgi:hypothetical protein